MSHFLSDSEQDHLREQAAERRQKYADLRAEQFLGDGWPEIPVIEPVEARVDLGPAERLAKLCPECGKPDTRWHGCPAKE